MIWSKRWIAHEQHFHRGDNIFYGWWEVYCTLHGEVYGRYALDTEAGEKLTYLNDAEAGPLRRIQSAHDELDTLFTYTEVWCHGAKIKGQYMAGWYPPGSASYFNYVEVRLAAAQAQEVK